MSLFLYGSLLTLTLSSLPAVLVPLDITVNVVTVITAIMSSGSDCLKYRTDITRALLSLITQWDHLGPSCETSS